MAGELWSDEQEKPLQHLRVIDMTVMLPGPLLTRVLAQYGADVIKVEGLPHGDPLRSLKNTAMFDLMNQGKRSVAVDLKNEIGCGVVKQLAGESDVFIENFRDGVMDSLGLGYSELSEENPDLIYVSVRGLSGSESNKAGHDLNFVAHSGCGEWFLEAGAPNYSSFFADIVGGTLVPAIKLLMHLSNPARRGMHLVTYMDEGFRSLYLHRAYDHYKAESLPEAERPGFGVQRGYDGSQPHSRYYRCRDNNWVALNAAQPKHWELFCEVVDRAPWKTRQHDPALIPEIEKLFLDAPSSYWEALTAKREFCLFRVIPWSDHYSFSQARAQFAQDPLTWAGFLPNPNLRSCPTLGQDTFTVIHGLGVSNKEIADMMKNGHIK